MRNHKILNIVPPDSGLRDALSNELGISKILAQALINRGLKNPAQAKEFLSANLSMLLDPYQFLDMQKAVSLIRKTAANKEKVLVFGDYDVDGVTALSLLKGALLKMGLDTEHYIPHRIKEGYSLNKNIIGIAKQKNIKLLITVDCGTSSHAEIKELRQNNIDVIITDHHEPSGRQLPGASAIINPKTHNCGYRYKELAGVGVAYKLCQALTGSHLAEELDLVSLGTISDVVPLSGENRIIVREGLLRLANTNKVGLRALIESSGIKNKKINSTFVSYILGPRINASGRMDSAETALKLLMSKEESGAGELVKMLEAYNRQRQKIESRILEEAQDLISGINFKEDKVIVIAKEDWHQGVLGIVASKLADRFYRPTIMISLTQDLCKGSGRSIKNFHLFHALLECDEFLEAFGGHSHAVGLVINKNNIEDFRNKINSIAKERLHFEDLIPSLDIDMEVSFSALNEEVIRELEELEPFGNGNPEPLFYTRNLRLKGEPLLLNRDTLKFWATDNIDTFQVLGFGMGSFKESLQSADSFDLVYTPKIDAWQGAETILLETREIFFK